MNAFLYAIAAVLSVAATGPRPSAADVSRPSPTAVSGSVADAVVTILASDEAGEQQAVGTGFVVASDGIVATAWLTVAGCREVAVRLSSGETLTVEGVIGWEAGRRDFILLKATRSDVLRPLALGDSDAVQPPDTYSLVSPLPGPHVRAWEVRAVGRRDLLDGRDWIEVSEDLASEMSGSPIISGEKTVIGVALVLEAGSQSLTFAVPVNDVKALLAERRPVTALSEAIYPGIARRAQERFYTGTEFLAANYPEEALSALRESIELEPDFADARASLGEAYGRLQRWEEALAEVERALSRRSELTDIPGALLLLGDIYAVGLERSREAIEAYREAADAAPDYAEPHRGLAHAYMALGQFDRASDECRVAIRLDPQFADPHCCLGWIAVERGERQDALEALTRAATLDPGDAVGYARLALAFGSIEEWERAREALSHAERLDPGSEEVEAARDVVEEGSRAAAREQRRRGRSWDPSLGRFGTVVVGAALWALLLAGIVILILRRARRAGASRE